MKVAWIPSVGLIALALLATFWASGSSPSEAEQGSLYNCPEAGKWAISAWDGENGTETGQALATCGSDAVSAAYYLDPQTGGWLGWFPGRPDISNLAALNNLQGIIALGSATAPTPGPAPGPGPQPGAMQNCPTAGKWAISVWNGPNAVGADQALASCGAGAVSAAYYLDPQTGGWLGWFAGRPDISSLTALNNLQGIITLGSGGFRLSLDKFGEGTVTSSPGGIDCGAGCTFQAATFASDSSIVLTATADPGSTFSYWSGCDSVSGNSCTVDMDGDNTVFATFAFTEVKIPETTKVLDAATMGYLIRQEGSTYYFGPQAVAVASLAVGDVIVGSTGEGFLRKVTAVNVTDQEIAVETTDATLEDAIERGTLLLSEQAVSSAGTLSGQDLTAAGVTCIVDELMCNVPIDVDLGDGVKISGFASFDADADIDVSYDGWHVGEIRAVLTLSGETTLTAVVGAGLSGEAKATVPVLKTTQLYMIGLPTVVSLDLSLEVGVTGSAKAGLESTVSMDNTFTVGGHYLRGQDWSAINEYTRTFHYSEPSVSLEADAKAYVKPVLNMKVDAIAGPYFDVEGFLKARVAPSETPWWTLKAGIGAEAGFRAGAFGLSVVDFKLPLWEKEWLLAQAQTQPATPTPAPTPTLSATPTPRPTPTPQGQHRLTMVADPPEGGATTPSPGSHSYAHGTTVGVSAAPNPDWWFWYWSGDCLGDDPDILVYMDRDKTCIANFACKPLVPGTYQGSVLLLGLPAPDDTLIEAFVGGLKWGESVTFGDRYALSIPEPMPVEPPCFERGQVIFYANHVACEPSPQWAGGLHFVDLTCE